MIEPKDYIEEIAMQRATAHTDALDKAIRGMLEKLGVDLEQEWNFSKLKQELFLKGYHIELHEHRDRTEVVVYKKFLIDSVKKEW